LPVGIETIDTYFSEDDDYEATPVDVFLDGVFENNEDFKFLPEVVPKQQTHNMPTDVVPSYIAVCTTMQNQPSGWLLKVLFNSRDTQTFLNSCCLLKGATSTVMQHPLHGITAAG
jgi:hypothetical protein